MTIIEVTIALTVVATVLMASAGAFSSSLSAVQSAKRTSQAAVFLQTVMENISAQAYADLPSFNGNRVYDQTTAGASNYAADITVFLAAVNLQQIQVVLIDLKTNRELGRLTTLRNRR